MTENKRDVITNLIGVTLMFTGALIGGWISYNITPMDTTVSLPSWWIHSKNILLLLGGAAGAGIYWVIYTKYLEKWTDIDDNLDRMT